MGSEMCIRDRWKEATAPDGRTYYYHAHNRITSWTRPDASAEPLPAGWKDARAPDGRTFYYHVTTKETRWARPSGEACTTTTDATALAAVAAVTATTVEGAVMTGGGTATSAPSAEVMLSSAPSAVDIPEARAADMSGPLSQGEAPAQTGGDSAFTTEAPSADAVELSVEMSQADDERDGDHPPGVAIIAPCGSLGAAAPTSAQPAACHENPCATGQRLPPGPPPDPPPPNAVQTRIPPGPPPGPPPDGLSVGRLPPGPPIGPSPQLSSVQLEPPSGASMLSPRAPLGMPPGLLHGVAPGLVPGMVPTLPQGIQMAMLAGAPLRPGMPPGAPPGPPPGVPPHMMAPAIRQYVLMPGLTPPGPPPGAPPRCAMPQQLPPGMVPPGPPPGVPPMGANVAMHAACAFHHQQPHMQPTQPSAQPQQVQLQSRAVEQPTLPEDAAEQGPQAPKRPKALPAELRPQMMPTAVRVQRAPQPKPRTVSAANARIAVSADLSRPLQGKSRIARPTPELLAAKQAQADPATQGGEGGGDAYDEFMASLKSLGAY